MRARFEKSFNATLFDCIDYTLTRILGRDAIATFYYAITEQYNIPLLEFERRPAEILQHLSELIGVRGFEALEESIALSVKEAFEIGADESIGLRKMIDLAKDAYLSAET
ncbi:MAG: hypothetical protein JRN15_01950 [Nitrososphaerota archaeon]|nr:hypothetical protein [Nitrososphaerota archaeon]